MQMDAGKESILNPYVFKESILNPYVFQNPILYSNIILGGSCWLHFFCGWQFLVSSSNRKEFKGPRCFLVSRSCCEDWQLIGGHLPCFQGGAAISQGRPAQSSLCLRNQQTIFQDFHGPIL
jgi:hypothetical protein